jgi:hypothetical protein
VLVAVLVASRFVPAARAHFPSDLPPLFAAWRPRVTPWTLLALLLAVGFVVGAPGLLRVRLAAFLAALVAFVIAMSVALAISDGNPRTLTHRNEAGGIAAVLTAPIDRPTDYLSDVRVVRLYGPVGFAQNYPWLSRSTRARMSLRARTHPPGAVLTAWVLDGAAHDDRLRIALMIVAIGGLGVLPTYALARAVRHDERTARLAAVLFAACPIVLLYSATAFDAVFMTVAACAIALLAWAPRSVAASVAGGALAAGAITLSYGLLSLGLVAAGFFVLALARERSARLVGRAGACLAAFVVASVLLHRYAGIDLLASFRTASRVQHEVEAFRDRPWWYWTLGGDVFAFLIGAGLGLSSLLVVRTWDAWRSRRFGIETLLWAAMIASAAAGALRGETEHLWMYFVPMLAVAAAPAVVRLRDEAAFGLGQAGIMQTLFWTNW